MKVDLKFIFTGKTKDNFIYEGTEKYKKFLKKYGSAEILEIKSPSFKDNIEVIKKLEAATILKLLRSDSYKISLDIRGHQKTTEAVAIDFEKLINSGVNKFDFIVGGAFGFDQNILDHTNFIWKFSNLTFDHQLIRLTLLEQVYRILSIINNEKYHH